MKLNVQREIFIDELFRQFELQRIPAKWLGSNYIVKNTSQEFRFVNHDIEDDLGDEFFDAVHNTLRKFTENYRAYDVITMTWNDKKLSVDIHIEFGIFDTEKPNAEKYQANRDKPLSTLRHISIDTPCSVSDIEGFLHIVSHEGHWHDAVVKGEDGKIIIEFGVD